MFARAIMIWCVLLGVAIANGTVRVAVIIPGVGDYWGHILSTLSLSALIVLLAWFTIPWIGPVTGREVVMVSVLWVALTIGFEFLAGHYLFGASWSKLLADYNLAEGRIWSVVLVATFIAPVVSAWGRGLLRPA